MYEESITIGIDIKHASPEKLVEMAQRQGIDLRRLSGVVNRRLKKENK